MAHGLRSGRLIATTARSFRGVNDIVYHTMGAGRQGYLTLVPLGVCVRLGTCDARSVS
jgi:hypothetical protein